MRPPPAPGHSSLKGLADYRAHLQRTFRLGTGANGVFGAKLMWHHLPELHRLAGRLPEYETLDAHRLLRELFDDPGYVWVRRRDAVRQAVSMFRALQTRAWRQQHSEDREAPELTYSFAGIDHLVRMLRAHDDGWRGYFESAGIPVLQIVYEDHLEQDRERAVHAVLDHVGVGMPRRWRPAEPLKRQADELSEEWVAAYHRDWARERATGPATMPAR